MDLKATFTRKIGPLPMWAWAVGGGVGIGLYLRHRAAVKAAATPATDTTGQDALSAAPQFDMGGSGLPQSFAGGGFSGLTQDDVASGVAAGLGSYFAQNPPATTEPIAPSSPPQDAVPIAVTVQSIPPELHGGGPPKAAPRRVAQIAPRQAAPAVPAGTSPNRANSGVVVRGVDEGTLNAAMGITGRSGYPRVERSTMADRMRQHPDWGPYTLAHGGQVRGHSTRF